MAAAYSDLAGKVVSSPVAQRGVAQGCDRAALRAAEIQCRVLRHSRPTRAKRLARELSDQGLAAHFQRVDLTTSPRCATASPRARKAHGAIGVSSSTTIPHMT